MSVDERAIILKKIQDDPTFKGAFARPFSVVLYLNKKSSITEQFRICEDPYLTIPIVIYTRKGFYLLDALNAEISSIKSAGLIDFWHQKYVNKRFLHTMYLNCPQPLHLRQLNGCFKTYFVGCFAAVFAFSLENLYFLIRNRSGIKL